MEMGMQIDTKDFSKFPAAVQSDLHLAMRTAMRISTNEVVGVAKQHAPVGVNKALRGGIHAKVYNRTSQLIGDILSTAPYTMAVEEGTDPHWIPSGWRRGGGKNQTLSPAMRGLMDWVRLKLGKSPGVAWYVRARIAGNIAGKAGGTKAVRMFLKAYREKRRSVQRNFDLFIGRALRKHGGK